MQSRDKKAAHSGGLFALFGSGNYSGAMPGSATGALPPEGLMCLLVALRLRLPRPVKQPDNSGDVIQVFLEVVILSVLFSAIVL